MEKHQYICPKCGCQQYESDRLQATGGNFAKIFDIQNKKFVTISCATAGYTELYRQTLAAKAGMCWTFCLGTKTAGIPSPRLPSVATARHRPGTFSAYAFYLGCI